MAETSSTIETYNPTKPEHQGKDAATILRTGKNFTPVYLTATVEGLGQLVDGKLDRVVVFNEINPTFFSEVVCPLAEDLKKRGLDALGDWGVSK